MSVARWILAKAATRAPAFKLDPPLEHEGCAFCAALNRATDDGSGNRERSVSVLVPDLDELERQHGACVCLEDVAW